jgi:protein TonB
VTILHEKPGDGAPAAQPAPPPAAAKPAAKPKPAPAPKPTPIAAPAPAPAAASAEPAAPAGEAAEGAPDGAAEGAAQVAAVGAGPPGAGATDGGDPLAAYIRQVRDSIARHKRYPALARRRGIQGRVLLRLAIGPDGSLQASEAVDSPSVVLARSALQAVEAASPFGPPPTGGLRIEVPIRYSLEE